MGQYLDVLPAPARPGIPLLDLISDAQRQLEICNACRYCEGYCAVFPALERRTAFTSGDVQFIANLCHDCRACYYACPYAPPHEFGVNIPAVLSAVRTQTYQRYAFPARLSQMATRAIRSVTLLVLLSLLVVVTLVFLTTGPQSLIDQQLGPGSFYRVLPYLAMVIPAMAISVYGITILLVGGWRFWRETRSPLAALVDLRTLVSATVDVFVLRYLQGGGDGCFYPEDRPSYVRLVLHSLVFYGFLVDLAATTVAAIEQELFGILPPYPVISLPVLLGVIGGVGMIVGCTGLMALKLRSDVEPATQVMRSMDFAFLAVLNLASITGMLVLVFRESAGMGVLLTLHLAVLGGLYITAPYTKFAHVVYRYAALLQNKIESREEGESQTEPVVG